MDRIGQRRGLSKVACSPRFRALAANSAPPLNPARIRAEAARDLSPWPAAPGRAPPKEHHRECGRKSSSYECPLPNSRTPQLKCWARRSARQDAEADDADAALLPEPPFNARGQLSGGARSRCRAQRVRSITTCGLPPPAPRSFGIAKSISMPRPRPGTSRQRDASPGLPLHRCYADLKGPGDTIPAHPPYRRPAHPPWSSRSPFAHLKRIHRPDPSMGSVKLTVAPSTGRPVSSVTTTPDAARRPGPGRIGRAIAFQPPLLPTSVDGSPATPESASPAWTQTSKAIKNSEVISLITWVKCEKDGNTLRRTV